ncbi:MAG TPA: DUF459 domain-containing protein [Enhygromyxa sp.]|nr:DUF459 domain-containing protein [Enhygromyxa sp.]
MTSSSFARGFALSTLTALGLLACTTGASVDAPPAAIAAEPSEPGPASEVESNEAAQEVPSEDAAVLAKADPTAAQDDPEPAVAEADPVEPDDAAPQEPRTVLILGDSLAATGFGALLEEKLDAHPDVVCYRKAKSASGLARPDFYDWFDQGARQVEFRKPDLVVVVMGGNDGQDLPAWKGSSRVNWDTAGWPGAYRARVDDFLGKVTAPVEGGDAARVLWLGLPQMGMRSLEKKLVLIRQIQQEAVAALGTGGVYLDTTQFLVDENGQLLSSAPVQGKTRELRAEDGIHFTMSGSEYLADKVYPEILVTLGLPAQEPAAPSK